MTAAGDISRALAERIDALAAELLPAGHREGHEWRAGSIAGEAGSSLGVHLSGQKAGVWCDFATGEKGDSLDLIRASLRVDMPEALSWSRCWLGIEDGSGRLPEWHALKPSPKSDHPDRWRYPWRPARPIVGTLAENYLRARGLDFHDPEGRVLRFAACRARKDPAGDLEHHPALICALSDARTGEQCGIINIYLRADGSYHLRDNKAKTVAGRARGAVVMLSGFDEPTMGLTVCEGVEIGIAIFQSGATPSLGLWFCRHARDVPAARRDRGADHRCRSGRVRGACGRKIGRAVANCWSRSIGRGAPDRRLGRPMNAREAADAGWDAQRRARQASDATARPNGRDAGLQLGNAAELVARQFNEPKWAVPQIVAEGLTILAGRPKTEKAGGLLTPP